MKANARLRDVEGGLVNMPPQAFQYMTENNEAGAQTWNNCKYSQRLGHMCGFGDFKKAVAETRARE